VQRSSERSCRIGKKGVYEAGGIPLELPVVSLGETQVRPTAMLWRNMAAMATEEMLRANPIDGRRGCVVVCPTTRSPAVRTSTASGGVLSGEQHSQTGKDWEPRRAAQPDSQLVSEAHAGDPRASASWCGIPPIARRMAVA
jgi:hypothetical protein